MHKISSFSQGFYDLKEEILNGYSNERRDIGLKNLNIAMKYYEKSLEIPKIVGLDIGNLRSFKTLIEKIPFLPQNASSFLFKAGVKIGAFPIEIKNFQREKQILNDEKNQIPLIFIEEDVRFQYGSNGKLCPLFLIKFDNQKEPISSRELLIKVKEFVEKKQLKPISKRKNETFNDFLLVFFRNYEDLPEIRRILDKNPENSSIFLRITSNSSIKKLKENKEFSEIEVSEVSPENTNLKELPSYFLVRSDGHLISNKNN